MPKLPKEIEERFDDYFHILVNQDRLGKVIGSQIKSFIATILDEERERIVNRIEKLKIEVIDNNGCTGTITSGWCCPKHKLVNNTLDKIINLIKEYK